MTRCKNFKELVRNDFETATDLVSTDVAMAMGMLRAYKEANKPPVVRMREIDDMYGDFKIIKTADYYCVDAEDGSGSISIVSDKALHDFQIAVLIADSWLCYYQNNCMD